MTSMNHIVVDVSSDEEDDDKRVDYSDFFDGILEVSDEKPKSTDLFNLMVKNEDGDDDCVILDCDPTAKETAIETCETDEVLVVGQKGEIACRDFPHPRHACAKYPFKSTLHQQFCEMCHCYVCETRAPCPYWFSGFSILDHCHANDKEQTWKNQRECIRTRINGSQPRGVQSSPNNRGGSYNGNPSPQAVPSNPFVWTRRPSRRVSHPENGVQTIAQGSQATCYTPPAASQGNAQQIVTGYISTVPVSHSKEYARHFNRNIYSGNLQTNEVPSMTPNPPANQQQQQSGRSNDKALSEFEDWLLDDSTLLCPLFGQDNATTVAFDFETFLND